jgi:hypothetical protein
MTARRSASFVVFALAAIAASAAVDAQPAGKVRHIGFIAGGSASTGRTLVDAFRVGLRGGNVTGVGYTGDVWVKELEILKEALPSARRVALLSNPRNPSHPAGVSRVKAAAVRWG